MGSSMEWIRGRWHEVAGTGSATWLAWAVWALLALGVIALIYANVQIRRNRRHALDEIRPHVNMFMEPHAADWHVIELVVRNFGKTSAYDISFTFPHPPTVAEYENATDGYADVVELQLPRQLPTLAPGQEWRTVWDSALDRSELGEGIESRFPGTVTYFDRVETPRGWKFWQSGRRPLQTKVVLDWATRRVLSWRLSITMEAAFCVETLEDALARHGRPEIFNTDQGSQFTGSAFTSVLASNGIAISMDGKGAWRDNVFVERLWRSVKYEEVYLRAYETVGEARHSLGRYLDFYHGRRPHSSLDAVTPDQAYFTQLPLRVAA